MTTIGKDLFVILIAALMLLWINDCSAGTRKQCSNKCLNVEQYAKCMKECVK